MTAPRRSTSGRIRDPSEVDAHPWARVPPQMARTLRSELPATIQAVVHAVADQVPQYRADPDDPVHIALAAGVSVALERLVDLLGTNDAPLSDVANVYDRIGAREYAARRPLEDVLSAYRVGATTTWRCFSELAVNAGSPPEDIAALAEAAFTYINEISATSTAGYARAQASDAGARSRTRTSLIKALLNGDLHSTETERRARDLRWQIPDRVVALLLSEDTPDNTLARLNDFSFTIAGHVQSGPVAICRAPLTGDQRAQLARTIGPDRASAGISQGASSASKSLAHAIVLADQRDQWGLPDEGIVWADEHLSALLVSTDPSLGEALRRKALAPFADLSPEKREPLLETLRWWLLLHGSRQQVASAMTLHPQTISYRMDRIRELLGADLEKAGTRWDLTLAVMSQDPQL